MITPLFIGGLGMQEVLLTALVVLLFSIAPTDSACHPITSEIS